MDCPNRPAHRASCPRKSPLKRKPYCTIRKKPLSCWTARRYSSFCGKWGKIHDRPGGRRHRRENCPAAVLAGRHGKNPVRHGRSGRRRILPYPAGTHAAVGVSGFPHRRRFVAGQRRNAGYSRLEPDAAAAWLSQQGGQRYPPAAGAAPLPPRRAGAAAG